MIEVADLAIEPEMDAGDRRRRELAERGSQRRSRRSVGQHAPQHIERDRQNQIVEFLFLPVRRHVYGKRHGLERFHAGAKLDLSATCANVVSGGAVQVGERHGWNSHAPGSRRLEKRLAHHLRRIGYGNPIEIFVQGADQDCLPETLDGLLGLSVSFEPVEKRLAAFRRNGSNNLEPDEVGPALARVDVVGEGEDRLRVSVVVLETDFHAGVVSLAVEIDRLLWMSSLFLFRYSMKRLHPAVEVEDVALLRLDSFVGHRDVDSLCEKGELAQPVGQDVEAELDVLEDLLVRLEPGHRPMLCACHR